MKYVGRRRPQYKARENNSFWLSFSDLMSMLVMMFVLVLFYSIYQYLNKTDEANEAMARLLVQQEQTQAQQLALDEKNQELEASQAQLTEQQKALLLQEARLLLARRDSEEAKALLDQQEAELESIRAQLALQETELRDQQTLVSDQQQKLLDQQRQLDEMVGVRTRIIASLAKAFSDVNIRAAVDSATGSITFDDSVLFDFASSELKSSGKAALDQFLPVYLSVLMSDENEKNISEIIIEGHTDPRGSFMSNLELSQRRAFSVIQYILSDEYSKITPEMKEKLRKIVTANGRSYSNPVPDPDGNVDEAKSRRVEFKFRMNDQEAVERIRNLLSETN